MKVATEVYAIKNATRREVISGLKLVKEWETRIELIQETFRADQVSSYFDYKFLKSLVTFTESFFEAKCNCLYQKKSHLGGFKDYCDGQKNIAKDDRDPPFYFVFIKGEEIVAEMFTERWDLLGGDQPYSDSITYVLLIDSLKSDRFFSALREYVRLEVDFSVLAPREK